ncbi:unnamed protein product [Closterium sp. NIES-64]|nr:unnamed protein product [Closterium sp. NIES-64]
MTLGTFRRTPRKRRAPTLAAAPWPLAAVVAAVVTVVVAMAGVTGVDGGAILQDSQVQFLRDCQDAWGNPSTTWPADHSDSNWDCGALEFVSCDENGMIVSLDIENTNLQGPIPDSISNLGKLETLYFGLFRSLLRCLLLSSPQFVFSLPLFLSPFRSFLCPPSHSSPLSFVPPLIRPPSHSSSLSFFRSTTPSSYVPPLFTSCFLFHLHCTHICYSPVCAINLPPCLSHPSLSAPFPWLPAPFASPSPEPSLPSSLPPLVPPRVPFPRPTSVLSQRGITGSLSSNIGSLFSLQKL